MSTINFSESYNAFTRQIGLDYVKWEKRSDVLYVTKETYTEKEANKIVSDIFKALKLNINLEILSHMDSTKTTGKRIIIWDADKFNDAITAQRTKIGGSASEKLPVELGDRKTQLKMSKAEIEKAGRLLYSLCNTHSYRWNDNQNLIYTTLLKVFPDLNEKSFVSIVTEKDKYVLKIQPIYGEGFFSPKTQIITDANIEFILETFEKNKPPSPKPFVMPSHWTWTECEKVKDHKEEPPKSKREKASELLRNFCNQGSWNVKDLEIWKILGSRFDSFSHGRTAHIKRRDGNLVLITSNTYASGNLSKWGSNRSEHIISKADLDFILKTLKS